VIADEKPRSEERQDADPRPDPAPPASDRLAPKSDTPASPPPLRVVDAVVQPRDPEMIVAGRTGWLRRDDRPHVLVPQGWGRNVAPYRPHITERPLRRIDAFSLPCPRARIAIVIVTGRSRAKLVGPDARPPRGEILRRRGTLYEVDLGLHHTDFELELPAKGKSCGFRLIADVEWRVSQPVTVVTDNLGDIREALAVALRIRIGDATREYDVAEMADAEAAVRDALHSSDVGAPYGLKTTIVVRLTADEKSHAYSAERRELKRAKKLENLRHRNAKREDGHERKRQRQRMEEYRRIVASGNVDQFALQLARRPEDVAAVIKMAREERYEERKQFTDLVSRLVQSGAISRWEVDDQVRVVLEWLAESTDRVMRSDVIPDQRYTPPSSASASTNGARSGGEGGGVDETTNGHAASH
jgi:hypothetical protein